MILMPSFSPIHIKNKPHPKTSWRLVSKTHPHSKQDIRLWGPHDISIIQLKCLYFTWSSSSLYSPPVYTRDCWHSYWVLFSQWDYLCYNRELKNTGPVQVQESNIVLHSRTPAVLKQVMVPPQGSPLPGCRTCSNLQSSEQRASTGLLINPALPPLQLSDSGWHLRFWQGFSTAAAANTH